MRLWIFLLVLTTPACELIDQPKGQYFVLVDDAGGLREGDPVFVSGVRAGRVGVVRIEGDLARVDFTMDKAAKAVVKDDACVSVGWYGAGEAHLRLRLGTEGRTQLTSGQVTCVENPGKQAKEALEKATRVMEGIAEGKGTIGRLLRDEKLADKVERFFEARPTAPAPSPPPVVSSEPDPAVPAAPAPKDTNDER